MNKEAANFKAIYEARENHNKTCSTGATGVGMCAHDIERMQWEEGDVIAGLTLKIIDIQPDRIRILCDGVHPKNEVTENETVGSRHGAPKVGELIAA